MRLFNGLILAALLFAASGCDREAKPPPPLPLAQMPSALTQAFNSAAPGVREIVEKINAAIAQNDLPGAYQGVQILCSLREATGDQRMIATRAMLSLTTLLQEASAAGNKEAAEALQGAKIYK